MVRPQDDQQFQTLHSSSRLSSVFLSPLGTPQPEPLETSTNSSTEQDDLLSGSILIAEDVIVNQKVAIGLLQDQNLKIDIANNGQEAL